VGPNCLGVISAEKRLSLPFISLTPWVAGSVSLISQSGGVGAAILTGIQEHNISANKFVSLGNKYCLDEVDFLKYFIQDEGTKVILMYLESMERGREFVETAKSSDKPIILYKANVTGSGASRAMSHTSALANDDEILDAAVRQAGVIRVKTLDQLIQFPAAFLLPEMKGDNISIISPAGGFTVLAADHAEEHGFKFPMLSEETQSALKQYIRAGVIQLGNPIDLGDALSTDAQLMAIDKTLEQPEIDGSIYMTSRRQASNYKGPLRAMLRNPIPELAELALKHRKPVVSAFVGAPELVKEYRGDTKLPVYNSPELAIRALAAFRDFCHFKRTRVLDEKKPAAPKKALALLDAQPAGLITGNTAFEIIESAGIKTVSTVIARSAAEAAAISSRMGFPVVMKIDCPGISHKTESGGVRLGLDSSSKVKAAYADMAALLKKNKLIGNIVIQKMAGPGVEVILGARRDPSFGQVLMFGMGGIFVEALRDVVFRLAPVTPEEAAKMIDSVRAGSILKGLRGFPPSDKKALIDAIVSLGRMIAFCPRIVEMDINPLIVLPKGSGCLSVDARIVLD